MPRLTLLTSLSLCFLPLVAEAEEGIQIDRKFFEDPEFIKAFVGSYAAIPEVEPKISEEENTLLGTIGELMKTDKKAASARLLQSLHSESSPVMFFILGNLYFEEKNLAAAKKAYDMAIERYPKFRRAHKNLAYIHAQQQKYELALEPLLQAMNLGDNDSRSFGLLAVCYMSKESYLAAESAYRQAFILDPEKKDWQTGLVNALVAQKKFQEAADMLDQLLADEPGNVSFLNLQANCYVGLREPLEAASNFEIIRHLGKADARTLDALGEIYMNQRLFIPALGAFIAATEQQGGADFDRALKTAKILSDYGALEEAQVYINKIQDVTALDAQQAIQLDTIRAKVLRGQKKDAEAADLLQSLVERDPSNGTALIELALYKEQSGEIAKAKFYFDMALKVEDSAYDANLRYGQMLVRQGKSTDALSKLKRAQELKNSDSLERYIRRVERAARLEEAARQASP